MSKKLHARPASADTISADADEVRYAAAWEASDHPQVHPSTRLSLRRLAGRRSARVAMIVPLLGAVGGAWWLFRRRRDR